ncbi:M15 family metallopeptidase [Paludicola sp. MB14-C6]|uniref:M15 family metallopeptidase n=1 Tax=Paludihabitans sp. MB14-C6 TaxID=3070656 RepID=UPI0027DD5E81|nr:M15 family metallopeptidase [Paludicola sp. MB14-C6]WMJ22983.1 M15 family metallopeptidase [Paludicola sp. MB14-C6]
MNKLFYQRRQNTKEKLITKIKVIIMVAMILVICVLGYVGVTIAAKSENRDVKSLNAKISEQMISSQTVSKSNQSTISSGQAQTTVNSSHKTDQPASINGRPWNLVLVNRWNKIDERSTNIKLTQLKNGQSVDERIYPELQKMMDDCRAAGLSPLICSSYRTTEKQTRLYNNQIDNYIRKGFARADAVVEAGKWSAIPGTSEHQLGLAVDIVSTSNQMLDKSQEQTAEQKWLMENSYKYGFILRYPSSKSQITGINYEPWHYRYVGKEAAAAIKKQAICLEEYLKK